MTPSPWEGTRTLQGVWLLSLHHRLRELRSSKSHEAGLQSLEVTH